jgi:hypothetical protein
MQGLRSVPDETAANPSTSQAREPEQTRWFDAAVIAIAGLALLNGAWRGGFTSFDDRQHLDLVRDAFNAGWFGFMRIWPTWSYMPATILSYQFDRTLFSNVLHITNWAPWVRAMTYLYHIGAALALWRIMLLLRFRRFEALFIAVFFSAHPMACETVAWVSERKNALSAMFGFAALWAWLGWGTDIGVTRAKYWHIPAATALYALALVSKPSALGLLPVFGLLEIAPFGPCFDGAPLRTRMWRGVLRCLPPTVIAVVIAIVNVHTHGPELCQPPGGTVFTAMLTDLEIVPRYLFNLAAPSSLSAMYYVNPIVSLHDPRVGYLVLLIALGAATVLLSQHRWRTLLAWGWFIGALGPNLNLIAIPLFMQDRYVYLSTPAFAMILTDVFVGVLARVKSGAGAPRIAAGVYVLALASMAAVRAPIFGNALTIFADAVEKQPLSANARYGLGMTYLQATENVQNLSDAQTFRKKCAAQWEQALRSCPDVKRFPFFSEMALRVGEEYMADGNGPKARQFWLLSAYPPPNVPPLASMSMAALSSVIIYDNAQGRLEESVALANDLVTQYAIDERSLYLHARTVYLLAEKKRADGDRAAAVQLIGIARSDLSQITPDQKAYSAAQAFLKLLDQF